MKTCGVPEAPLYAVDSKGKINFGNSPLACDIDSGDMKICGVPDLVKGPPPESESVVSVQGLLHYSEFVLTDWPSGIASTTIARILAAHIDDLRKQLAEKTDNPARTLYMETLLGNMAVRLTLTT